MRIGRSWVHMPTIHFHFCEVAGKASLWRRCILFYCLGTKQSVNVLQGECRFLQWNPSGRRRGCWATVAALFIAFVDSLSPCLFSLRWHASLYLHICTCSLSLFLSRLPLWRFSWFLSLPSPAPPARSL